jgi:hypothetical protein
MRWLALLVSFVLFSSSAVAADDIVLIDDFEQGLSPEWSVKRFKEETLYQVIAEESTHVLQATSSNSASALIYQQEFSLEDYQVLSWRWKVSDTIKHGDATRKQTDDYAARVYIIFPHWFFLKTKSLNYIWANKIEKGRFVPSPYTGNSIMLAVESGSDRADSWQTERRNIAEDFLTVFGTDPPDTFQIAIMTDTDNTGGRVNAWYDDLTLEKEK